MSTIGSVAGVLVTAFMLIPYISNFSAALVVALVLALLSLAAVTLVARSARRAPGRSAIVAGAAALVSAVLLWQADAYIGRMWPAQLRRAAPGASKRASGRCSAR